MRREGKIRRIHLPALVLLLLLISVGAAAQDLSAETWDRSDLTARFEDSWIRFFGGPPILPEELDLSAAESPEVLFALLWESSRADSWANLAEDRLAARRPKSKRVILRERLAASSSPSTSADESAAVPASWTTLPPTRPIPASRLG